MYVVVFVTDIETLSALLNLIEGPVEQTRCNVPMDFFAKGQ